MTQNNTIHHHNHYQQQQLQQKDSTQRTVKGQSSTAKGQEVGAWEPGASLPSPGHPSPSTSMCALRQKHQTRFLKNCLWFISRLTRYGKVVLSKLQAMILGGGVSLSCMMIKDFDFLLSLVQCSKSFYEQTRNAILINQANLSLPIKSRVSHTPHSISQASKHSYCDPSSLR